MPNITENVETKIEHNIEVSESEDLGGLKSALSKERQAAKDAKRQADLLAKEKEALEARLREIEEAKLKDQGQWKELYDQKENELKNEREKRHTSIINSEALRLASQATKDPSKLEDLEAHLKKHARLGEGDSVTFVLNEQPITAENLLEHYKKTKSYLFDGSMANGSGATGGEGKGFTQTFNRSKMNSDQKAEYIREHGKDSYFKLPK